MEINKTSETVELVEVACKFCQETTNTELAHLHQSEYVGECCWDDRLKVTE